MNVKKEMEKIVSDTTIWTPKILKPQTIILHQGSEITHSYYLKEGIIKVYNDEEGENTIINLLSDETILPFDNSTNKFFTVNMITLEKTILYKISNDDFRQLRRTNSEFNQIVEEGILYMMDSLIYRSLAILKKEAIDKYKTALKYYPCLNRMSNVAIGYFINVAPETVGRIKKEINDKSANKEKEKNKKIIKKSKHSD